MRWHLMQRMGSMATSYYVHSSHLHLHQMSRMALEPILCICVCFTIDAVLNVDFDADANAKVIRKQGFNCIKRRLTLQHDVQYIRFYRYRSRTPW